MVAVARLVGYLAIELMMFSEAIFTHILPLKSGDGKVWFFFKKFDIHGDKKLTRNRIKTLVPMFSGWVTQKNTFNGTRLKLRSTRSYVVNK